MAEPEVPDDLDAPILPWQELWSAAKHTTEKVWPLLLGVPLALAVVAGMMQWWIGGANEKAWDDVTGSAFLASLITFGFAILLVIVGQLVFVPLVRARHSIASHRQELRDVRKKCNTALADVQELRAQRDEARHDRGDALRDLEEARARAIPDYTGSIFRNQRIYLTDLGRDGNPIIERKTFVDCVLIGPCTVTFINSLTLTYTQWLGVPPEDLIAVVPDTARVHAAVAFSNCTIDHCDWENVKVIAFAGYEAAIRSGIATGDPGEPGPRSGGNTGVRE